MAIGLLLAAFGTLLLPIGDAVGKHLTAEGYHPFQVAWGRWISHFVLITPLVLWQVGGWRGLRVEGIPLQIARSLVLTVATVFYFSALQTLPLADAAAILFFAPLLVVALAALFLKERVGAWRWLGVFCGFLGVLLIVKPSGVSSNWGSLLAFGATCSFSLYFLLTRKAAGRNKPLVTLWFMGLVGGLAMTPFALYVWMPLSAEAILGFFSIGLVMAVGHLFLIQALDFIEASAVAPLAYLEIVTATVIGYFWFGDLPDRWTWLGCALVMAAGLFVMHRERAAAHRKAKANQSIGRGAGQS